MSRRLKLALSALILIMCWIVVAPLLATWLIVQKPLAHADAIIVLSGSAVYKERTQKAAELYKQGVAPRIFITDDGEHAGWSRTEKTNPPFVELEQRELVANGVDPAAIIVLSGQVSGTDQEAKALLKEITDRPLSSVLIVTSAYHSRRALRAFERMFAGKGVTLGIDPADPGENSPSFAYWWLSSLGWRTVAGEYVKSVVYWAYS